MPNDFLSLLILLMGEANRFNNTRNQCSITWKPIVMFAKDNMLQITFPDLLNHWLITTHISQQLRTDSQKIPNVLKPYETSLWFYFVTGSCDSPMCILRIIILSPCQKADSFDILYVQISGKESRVYCLHAGGKEAKI